MKEKLENLLGSTGLIIWMVLTALSVIIPISYLPLPIWSQILLVMAITFLGKLGGLIFIGLFIWSIFCYVGCGVYFDVWGVLYIISGIVNLIFTIIPTINFLFKSSK